jgi:hypothetical protein
MPLVRKSVHRQVGARPRRWREHLEEDVQFATVRVSRWNTLIEVDAKLPPGIKPASRLAPGCDGTHMTGRLLPVWSMSPALVGRYRRWRLANHSSMSGSHHPTLLAES